MTKAFLAALLLLTPAVRCLASGCEFSPAELDKVLALDYAAFDQTENQGARLYAAKGCHLQAAQLTDVWQLHHQSTLESWQARVLHFHAGQLYAQASKDSYGIAVARFQKSSDPREPPSSPFGWNAYVAATIAFLQGDLEAAKTQLLLLRAKKNEANDKNIAVVEALIKCFGRPYLEAYSPACVPR